MATLSEAISKDFFESVLPVYGTSRVEVPVWDEGQKMFLCGQYESASGHRYYKGIRFCNNFVIVEKVGLFHSWTYIDAIEIYAFNGTRIELVQKRDYTKVFRSEEFVRAETEKMLCDYLNGVLKMSKRALTSDSITTQVKSMVDKCYKSFLDSDYNITLTQVLPQLECK